MSVEASQLVEWLEPRRLMANIIQVTTGTDGVMVVGSLRAAIVAANATPGSTIEFTTLPAATPIVIASNLPAITAAGTTIDGTTGPGGRVEIDGNPAKPVEGAATGTGFVALDIQAAGAVVKGLSLKFCSEAIILDTGSSGAVITNNYIGDVTNSGSGVNQIGIEITNGSHGNTIGGASAALENVISGNFNSTAAYTGTGILIEDPLASGTTANIVEGNLIGLTPTGTLAAENGRGIVLSDVQNNTVENNQIAGSTYAIGPLNGNGQGTSTNGGGAGIVTVTSGTVDREGNNIIENNTIGENSAGVAIPNQIGVFVENGTGTAIGDTFSGNTVGDNTGAGFDVLGTLNMIKSNTITSNGGTGVVIQTSAEEDTISQNSISLNGATSGGDFNLGIDLGNDGVTQNTATSGTTDAGANGLVPYPTLSVNQGTNFDTVNVALSANPNTQYTIEIFGNTAATRSTTGHGQGLTYLGSVTITTNSTGIGTATTGFATSLLSDDIAATATDSSAFDANTNPDAGATSEFSSDVGVTGTAGSSGGIALFIGDSFTLNEGNTTLDKTDAFFTTGNTTGPYTVTVDYGDGTGLQSVPFNSGSNTLTLIHKYPGSVSMTYVATVTVYDATNAARHSFDVTIVSNSPHNLTVTQQKHNAPTNAAPYRSTAHFLDAGAGNGDFFRVYVDYGDGTKIFRATTQHNTFQIGHQYTHPGSYTLTVTVIDDGGGKVVKSETVDVLTATEKKA